MLTAPTFRVSRLVLLAVVGALAATSSTASSSAAAAEQRYASPTGSGTACSSASPCSLREAVEGAEAGDEVIVNPGDYALTAALERTAQITIHGVAGRPRPRLLFNSAAGQQGLKLYFGSLLRYVEIDQAAAQADALGVFGAKVDQVIAKAPATAVHVRENSTVRDSIFLASGPNGCALAAEASGAGDTNTITSRNVTAIATGSGGVPVLANAAAMANSTVHLVNVIAYSGPGGVSLKAQADASGAEATITASYTNYQAADTLGSSAKVLTGAGNRAEDPIFIDAGAGDYRQAAGSPTIDAGLNAPLNGAYDLDGDPRTLGPSDIGAGTTDIGADEFVVAPAATTAAAGAVTDHTATLSGSVNPRGVPTSYRFEYGRTTAYGSASPTAGAGSGRSPVPAGAKLGNLSPATTYHYRLVATNAGGVTRGADRTFTTAVPSPPPHSAPPPIPAFAGVALVSPRLTYARRSITVRLRCAAGTVGRCAGRTKLTARPRRTSTRRVTLGRSGFSIAAGSATKITVRVTRAGRRLLRTTARLRGRATTTARDGASQSKTTVARVTIRRRHR